MKVDVTPNQGNFFKVLAFSSYNLEKLRYLRFLLSNYRPEKIQSFKQGKPLALSLCELNCSDIAHVMKKCQMSTTVSSILIYYLIQSYLWKRCYFPGKFMNFSEAATGGIL